MRLLLLLLTLTLSHALDLDRLSNRLATYTFHDTIPTGHWVLHDGDILSRVLPLVHVPWYLRPAVSMLPSQRELDVTRDGQRLSLKVGMMHLEYDASTNDVSVHASSLMDALGKIRMDAMQVQGHLAFEMHLPSKDMTMVFLTDATKQTLTLGLFTDDNQVFLPFVR